jgi:subtilase family serine protease
MLPKRTRFARFSTFVFAFTLFFSCFGAASVAQTATTVPVASRLTQKIDESQLVTLKGTVHPLANAANDKGAVDEGTVLNRVQVMLKRSPAQETALTQLLQQMHQPGTANYHRWLTPAQFGEQFGPSDSDIATLSSWLSSHGFTVTKVNPGKQTMEISGSAGQFQKTFHAAIHKYQVNGQMHTANASDPQIPAALAPVFGGFASLNNFPLKSYEKVLGRATYDPSTHKATPEWTVGTPTTSYYFLLAPGDFAVQYDLNPLYTAGTTGTGQTIGIINEANISVPLVNQYRTLFGLPANPPNVIIDGNDPGIDGVNNPDGPNGASGEAYLDVELSGAVAPAATVDLIIAGDTALDSGLGLAAQHAVYGDVAPVLSLSFGYCEAFNGSNNNQFWETLWEQAAAQGQTVMVSAGDAGSAACDNDNTQQFAVYGQQVNGIGSSPWNVSVGGTDFYYSSYNSGSNTAVTTQLEQYWGNFATTASNTTPTTTLLGKVPEQPWNDSQFGLNLGNQYADGDGSTIAGGGGGASNCATGTFESTQDPCAGYPKPAWQTGAGVPADGVRDLPDVSLFAANGANATYYPICAADGDCQPVTSGEVQITGVGGTSASSPAFAAMMALVNQKYGPQGQADFVLYPLAKQFPSAFNDVTVGTNSVPCNLQTLSVQGYSFPPDDCLSTGTTYTATDPTYGTSTEGQIGNTTTKVPEYNAGTGYDLATGLGTIDANNLVTNWNKVTFTSSSVTLASSQTTFAHGTAVTISGAVTPGTATGLVSLETTSSEPLNVGETTFPVGANGAYSGSVSFLPGGTYEIYGTYSGDGTYGASSSSKTSITVTPENSATVLYVFNSSGNQVASGATIPYGTQLLLEAQPGPATANMEDSAPTGSVNYLNGTGTVGTAPLNAGGEAELNYAPVPSATPYSITAQYSGDASYNPSTSKPATFTVGKDTPNLSLTSGTQSSSTITAVSGVTSLTVGVENYANLGILQGGSYAVNSAVAPTGVVTVTGLPSGTLTFPALSSIVDPTTLFIEGVATLPLPSETAGTYTVTISYPGDANYAATSGSTSLTISAPSGIPTTTTASATASTSVSATPIVTFLVTGTTAGGPPTGTVTFFNSGNEIGAVNIPSGGTGDTFGETLSLNGALATGTNELTVQYSGSSVYAPSFATVTVQNGGTVSATPSVALSNSGAITVIAGATTGNTSTITVTPGGGFTGAVALTCAVTPTTGTSVPTCTVANSPVDITGTTAGSATVTVATTSTTTTGAYTVTVSGTASGVTIAPTTVSLTVNAAVTTTPTVTLGGGSSITIASAGGMGTSPISVTPGGGFTGSVALACAVTATASDTPTCSITNPVSITGTTAGTATLTVNTTAASAAMEMPRMRLLPIGGGVAAAALLFFLVPMKRRRLSTLLGLMLLMAVVGMSTGCGSGSSSGGGGGGNSGTPAGTYTVTVSGTATGVTIAPITVSVTVQ